MSQGYRDAAGGREGGPSCRVLVCRGPDCTAGGSGEVYRKFAEALREKGLEEWVRLLEYACFGKCGDGPNVVIAPPVEENDFLSELLGDAQYGGYGGDEHLYRGVTPDDVDTLVSEHLLHGRVVERLRWRERED